MRHYINYICKALRTYEYVRIDTVRIISTILFYVPALTRACTYISIYGQFCVFEGFFNCLFFVLVHSVLL